MRRDAPTPDDVRAAGRRLGHVAPAGTVVALLGDLGAGKTLFAQGVGDALGLAEVVSPTFVVVQEHEGGRVRLVHADLYRVDDARDVEQLALDEAFDDSLVLVEWADRHPGLLPDDHLAVRLHHAEPGRVLEVHATGPRHAPLVEVVLGS